MKFKLGDFLLIFFILISSFLLFIKIKENSYNKKKLEVISPFERKFFLLNYKKKVKIRGEKGFLIFEIKMGKVRVIKSTCQNKICIKTGWISKVGESIVCVPNKIIIKIIGNKKNSKKIDFLTK